MYVALRHFGILVTAFCIWPCGIVLAEALTVRIVPAITDGDILEDKSLSMGASLKSIAVVAAPDQFEPASFVVYAHDALRDLKLTTTQLRDRQGRLLAGSNVDIRIVKRWYQRWLGFEEDKSRPDARILIPELLLYNDALVRVRDWQNYLQLESGDYINISAPAINNGFVVHRPQDFAVRDATKLQPLTIAAGENRQFWVTVYVPPDALAGVYTAEIMLRSADNQIAIVPVEVEVLPFRLSKSRIDYSIYYRGVLDRQWPDGSVSSEYKSSSQMLADFRNMRTHGIDNPAVYQSLAGGGLADVLDLRKQAGMAVEPMFYLGVDIAPSVDLAKAELYRAALPEKIRMVREIAARFNIKEVYFYARDEARDGQLLEQIPNWNIVRRSGGLIMAAGWRSDSARSGNFDSTGGNEDLFNALGMLSRKESAQWHAKGKLIYSYQNPTGGEELPETWRRNYGLLLWQYDYDGGMPYAWQHSYGDAWNDFDHVQYRDHNFTYPTVNGSIDTLQWEGLRSAVDDNRYLSTLLDVLDTPEGKTSLHALEARSWLNRLKDAPLGRMDLSAIREQIIGHILALKSRPDNAVPELSAGSPPMLGGTDDAMAEYRGQTSQAVAPDSESQPKNRIAVNIDSLDVGAVQPDGTAYISWRTSARSDSRVEVTDTRTRTTNVFESGSLDRRHVIRLSGLKPGREYGLKVESKSAALQAETVSVSLNTNTSIKVTSRKVSSVGGRAELDAGVASSYRASIGIDYKKSLMGWWRFTSSSKPGLDQSGRGIDASLESGAESGEGWFGRGLRLNGVGAHVDVDGVSFAKNGRATIEGWFRFRSFAMDNKSHMGIFSGLYQHEANNHFYLNGTNEYFAVASLLTPGVWHHIALSWDGDARSARLYIDGRRMRPVVQGEVENIDSISTLRIGDNASFFGKLLQRSSGTFDGDVDEVRVWSRVLGSEEIMASFDAGRAKLQVTFDSMPGSVPEWSIIGANAADQVLTD